MAPFIYRCPNTGFKVQGWAANDPLDAETFVSVDCPVCKSTHVVNPVIGDGPGIDNSSE